MVKLGVEMGDSVCHGLAHAAGVDQDELDLKEKLAGDRTTVLSVVCCLAKGNTALTSLECGPHALSPSLSATV